MKYFIFLLSTCMILQSCITDEDTTAVGIDFDASVSYYTQIAGLYDSLEINGSFEGIELESVILTSIDGASESLEIIESSTEEIIAFVPSGLTGGDYYLSIQTSEGTITTESFGDPLVVTVQERPIITSLSKSSMTAGEVITVSGEGFINPSEDDYYDAKVWIMKLNYTNTVSDIEVSEDGNSASVTIDDSVAPGTYTIQFTVGESSEYYTSWTNSVVINIVE